MNRPNAYRVAALGIISAAVATLITACGGSGSSSTPVAAATTTSLSGVVADGYLSLVKVCLDRNSNGVCDAGEPSGTSNTNGAYTITGITIGDETKYPIVAEVPSTSIDKDTSTAVGAPFTLTAPAGSGFVSPLTTIAHQKVLLGKTKAEADTAVQAELGISTSALTDYVSLKGNAIDQNNSYFRAHEAAKTAAKVLMAAKALAGSAGNTTDAATQAAVVQQAESVLLAQYAANSLNNPSAVFLPGSVSASSYVSTDTLKASIAAAKLTAAAATQAVTINFDVVNGATAVGTLGCTTNLTLGNGSGGAGTIGKIADLRFYVSGLALIDDLGNYAPVLMTENANQGRNVALMDFEDSVTGSPCAANYSPGMYTAVLGKVAPLATGRSYVGVAFTLGVPTLSADGSGTSVPLNQGGTATTMPLPLQNTSMNWGSNGRKFAKIEFLSNTSQTTVVYLGSSDCSADPLANCARPNRPFLKFDSFNASTQKIVLDLGILFATQDLSTPKTWQSQTYLSTSSYYFDKFQLDISTGLPINGVNSPVFVIQNQ